MSSTRIYNYYSADITKFETLLETAEANAVSEFEMQITSDFREKYEQYGDQVFINLNQIEALQRIANRR